MKEIKDVTMSKRFVYFDLGNVLVTFDPKIAARQLSLAAGCSIDRVLDSVFTSDVQLRYERGILSDDDYANEINHLLGSQLTTSQILLAVSEIFEPNWSILPILERLSSNRIPMGILSNTCDAHWTWLIHRDWPMLHGWFQHHILSYRVRYMKPDSGIYEASEAECGLSGSQIFFTDDREENVVAAANRGWCTHQYLDTDALSRALEDWLRE
jgi:FMN phosphatase YigB (HAD superfamily)